jgi:hypothetical protein
MKQKRDKSVMATHLPLLIRVFDLSEGDVLELGTGYFSTLVFHWLACMTKRHIVSVESNPRWYDKVKKFASDNHEIILVNSWDEFPVEDKHWGMVFIDHGPNGRRQVEIERLKDKADYIVIHDTEIKEDHHYHYTSIWPLFKYRKDYTKLVPNTSVVSNFKYLSNI